MTKEERLGEAVNLLEDLVNDETVPKNIREVTQDVIDELESDHDLNTKVDKAIQLLDEIVNDPNLPVYTRTQIWSAVSIIESSEED